MERATGHCVGTSNHAADGIGKGGPLVHALEGTAIASLPDRFEFHRLLSQVSSSFINLPAEDIDHHINQALGRVANFLGFNLAAISKFSGQGGTGEVTHVWTAKEIPSISPGFTELDFPWMAQRTSAGHPVHLASIDDLPAVAKRDRETYTRFGVRSTYNWPLRVGGTSMGCLSLAAIGVTRPFPTDFAEELERLAIVMGNALAREKADRDLRESEARLSLAADAADAGLWSLDLRTNCFWLTNKARELFGFAENEVVTYDRFLGLVHPEDRELVQKTADSLLQSKQAGRVEYRIVGADGKIKWILARGRINCGESGRSELLMGVAMDVTARKATEAALREHVAEIERLKDRLQAESDYLKAEIKVTKSHGRIIGQSAVIQQTLCLVERVAPMDSSVLIRGETGTGKELIAEEIHRLSPRASRVMVKVNCAALPAALVESELFGREKGAYTGALTRQAGHFEVADGSTIFLDEVGELSLEVQAKLLRVLQSGEFERLGSPRIIKVNVRIIGATNRDLADEVRKGRFRADLFYRLNVFPIRVPALRERVEDIPLLVWAFLEEFSGRMGRKINQVSRKSMETLQHHPWPGNVRELRNVMEHGVIITNGATLRLPMLESPILRAEAVQTLEDCEREHIVKALERAGWRIKGKKGAAAVLGLNPSTLYGRMRKLQIPNGRQKSNALC